jgi:hypothetical protein
MSPERGSLDPTAPSLLASGPERRAIAWWATLRPRVPSRVRPSPAGGPLHHESPKLGVFWGDGISTTSHHVI